MTDIETTAIEFWKCPACYAEVPFGSSHICSAQSNKDKTIPIYPDQLSIVEVNRKLDKIMADVKEIKEKLKDKV